VSFGGNASHPKPISATGSGTGFDRNCFPTRPETCYPAWMRLLVVAALASLAAACSRPERGPGVDDGDGPRPATAPAEQAPVSPALESDLLDYATIDVAAGYAGREVIIAGLVEVLETDYPRPALEAAAPRIVDELLAAHRAEEATWRGVTDCDRIDRAFAALDAAGILARQSYQDCSACAMAMIDGELEAAAAREAPRLRGYALFTDQDVETAVQEGVLAITHGDRDGTDAGRLAIGHEVVRALRDAGLEVEWSGDLDHRIRVDVTWHRRRFSSAP